MTRPALIPSDVLPALLDRCRAAGVTYRGRARGRTTDDVTLAGEKIPTMTDAELLAVAGLTEARHYGGRVRRWPQDPTICTVSLHTD